MDVLNKNLLTDDSLNELSTRFNNAPSFRHICIDNFLDPFLAKELENHFPSIKGMKKHYNGINEKKSEESDFNKLHESFRYLQHQLRSEAFINWLEKLTAIKNLSVPADFRGTGIYQGGRGSFLDTHIDFSIHPTLNLQRRLNILIFFNKNWADDWGGNLEFWNENVVKCIGKFSPIYNRCIIFECTDISYHGYDIITAPATVFRKSFYMYCYSAADNTVQYHDTLFRLKPGVTTVKKIKTAAKENLKGMVKNLLKQTGLQKILNRLEQ